MSIREEIRSIEVNQISIRNIEQLSAELKKLVLNKKKEIEQQYRYVPILSECLFLIINDDIPHNCAHPDCPNTALFNKGKYGYCSRKCSDTDPIRNNNIQRKRDGKIDYHLTNLKSARTRGEQIDELTGLNGHQLAGKKAVETREKNGIWKDNCLLSQSKISTETRKERSIKRQKTIEEKYGVSHFGGGISRLRDVEIFGHRFKIQGYEDVTIYQLIESGVTPVDIKVISQHTEYAIEYEFNGKKHRYFPDLLIKSQEKFIEVKSIYWYHKELNRCQAKQQAAKDKGIIVELKLYEDKNEISRIRKNIKRIEQKEN